MGLCPKLKQYWNATSNDEKTQVKTDYQKKLLNDELTNLKDKNGFNNLKPAEQQRMQTLTTASLERPLKTGVANKLLAPQAIKATLDKVVPLGP